LFLILMAGCFIGIDRYRRYVTVVTVVTNDN